MQMRTAESFLATTLLSIVAALADCAADDQPPAPSLRPNVSFNKHIKRTFDRRDGLPSSWINDVLQTRDGYVWIATDNGLVRYDGLHFKLFNRAVTQQLPLNEMRALYEGRDGCLWIGTTAGLTRYRPGRPGVFEEVPAASGQTVRAIYEDSANTLWIGTQEETYVRRKGLNIEIVEDAPRNVRAICEDQNGTLWLGSHFGLFRRQGTTYEQITHERLPKYTSTDKGVPQSRVNAILADDDGSLWIAANRALLHMRDGQFTSRGRELDSQQVYDLLRTRDGGLYVAARFGLYRSVGDGPFEEVSNEESAFCVMEDQAGGLWVGHGDNRGLQHYRNSPAQDVWTEARVRCMYDDPDGDLWFGSSAGLHRLRDGVITDYGIEDGLPRTSVHTIVPSAGKTLWIGTTRGFVKWSGTATVSDVTPAALAEMNIGAALEDSSGVLWFSLASAGGYTLKDGTLSGLPGLSQGRIHWFWQDPRGVIWIGQESGLFQHRDGEIRRVNDAAFDRLKNPRFLCHFAAGDGTLWMGTSNGIVRHQSDRFDAFSPESGLGADNIERMVADGEGNLWFGGRDGLFHARIAELDAVAAGRLPQVSSYRVEGFDRFPPLGAFSQGCLVRDGVLWIVAEHGLARMPIEPFQREPSPPTAHIEHVAVDGVAANFEERFQYKSGRRRLSIQFAVPAISDSRHVQVRYRLDGHDEDWVKAGSERVAHYTDLRPGEYRFRVAAQKGHENWIEAEPSMIFSVEPRWWETTWFYFSSAAILIGLIFVSTHQYTRRVRKRNAILQREIDERNRAERQMEVSEQRFRDLAESTRAIPWEADAASFQFTFVGRQAVDVLGYPVDDWLKEGFWIESIHPEDRLEAVEYCQGASERSENYQFEYRMIAADSAVVWIHDVVHVVRKEGVPARLIGFMIDVTDRRTAEDKARDYLGQLARINRAASMGEMATSIAHEVNQPLFAIVSNAQTAQRLLDREQPDTDEVGEALSDIVNDGNRAAKIIKHIRSMVRKEQSATEELDLNQVVHEAIQFIAPEIRKRALTLKTDLGEDLPQVMGSSIELQQVILNLIINAAQAMSDTDDHSRELCVRTLAANGSVELAVEDGGVGFDEEEAARLFEPFFTTKAGGTGMGLAINRTIVEAHGGRIWAKPNSERGATFSFTLPALSEATA